MLPSSCVCQSWANFASSLPLANVRRVRQWLAYGAGMCSLLLCTLGTAGAQATAQFLGTQITIPTSEMNQPESVAVDGAGNLYIADSDNGRVLREAFSSGSYTESVIASGFTQVGGIAVDSTGKVYFGDNGTGRIIIETPSQLAYTQSSVQTNGLGSLEGIAVDASGNIFVANNAENGTVVEESPSAGSYVQSTVITGLVTPKGIAIDQGGNLYIADTGNNRILKEISSNGSYIQSVVASSGLGSPWGIAVDSTGNIYIADAGNGRVLKEAPSGGAYAQSTVPSSDLNNALGIAIDSNDNVYVVQTETTINNILKLTPATTSAIFTPVGVGSHSATVALFFGIETGGTIGAPSVVTQGIAGLDFSDAGNGSCTMNGSSFDYAAGATCTVNVVFSPTRPGARYGAALLTDAAGATIATGYVQGVGIGPLVSFPPPAPTQLSLPGITNPLAAAVDSAGNLYIAQAIVAHDPGNAVFKETWNGSGYTQSTVATGLGYPTGVAVDGAGNVYIGDQDNFALYKETPSANGGYQQSVVESNLGTIGAIAVDGSGNVYVGRGGIGVEKETLSNGTYTGSEIFSTFYAQSMAVDPAGTLYIADGSNTGIRKETFSHTGYTESVIAAGQNVAHLALDGLGNIYFSNFGSNPSVMKETPSGNSYVQTTLITSGPAPVSAADASGNLYLANGETGNFSKLDFSVLPALHFATTVVGQTSTDSPQTITIANTGNAALSEPVPSEGTNPSIPAGFTVDGNAPSACPLVDSGSGTPGTLAAGASCELAVSFSPTAAGSVAASIVLTDNSLNAAPPNYTTQTISLIGGGTTATPVITWNPPAAIEYGIALGLSQLNATASVPGNFSYSPAAGNVLAPGTHKLAVTFTPADANDYTAATASNSLTVDQATPSLTLTASSNATFVSNPVTFTAALAPVSGAASGAALPTGSMTFFDGTTQLAVVPLSFGSAAYTTSTLAASTHAITAVYSGDANYLTATSPVLNEVVENFTVAPSAGGSTSAMASPGSPAVYTLVFTPPSGTTFPAPINLTVSGLPAGATATFSPASIPTGAGVTTVTLTVSVPNSSAMASPARPGGFGSGPVYALALLFLPWTLVRKKHLWRRSNIHCLLLVIAGGAALLTGIVGCGGGGSGKTNVQPQTYSLTVTATSGTLSNTTTLTLTVQ